MTNVEIKTRPKRNVNFHHHTYLPANKCERHKKRRDVNFENQRIILTLVNHSKSRGRKRFRGNAT